jgi:hypothetical protein
MADRQNWMFPHPPAAGIDREFDAMMRIHHESEDRDDERRIELAMAILLLSRNYDPRPDEYEAIFSFGTDQSARSVAQAAISELIHHDLEAQRVDRLPAQPQLTPPLFHTHFGTIRTSFKSCAARVRSTVAPWLQQPRSGR